MDLARLMDPAQPSQHFNDLRRHPPAGQPEPVVTKRKTIMFVMAVFYCPVMGKTEN